MDQLDPRLLEIQILSEADRAFASNSSYQYRKANPSAPSDRQRDEALLGLMFGRAIVGGTHYQPRTSTSIPDTRPPNPSHAIDAAAELAIKEFLGSKDILDLRITHEGRLRLHRVRDEVLQRDRVRDDFGVLWAHRHFRPDLEVQLRFRDPKDPFSLILIDVDNLKVLNTELGHPGADRVLIGVFEVLRDVVRPHEAYRLGGDEAGAVLPGVAGAEAAKLGEEIRRAVEARDWGDLPIKTRPTISVGVGTLVQTTTIDADALYAAVDRVAGRAKSVKNKVEVATVPETP